MTDRSTQLAGFYDAESADRASRALDPTRIRHRRGFLDLLACEGRATVLDVGSGPGRDAIAMAGTGLRVECVDLAAANVDACRRLGLPAHQASVLDLPLADDSFDAAWTMSTLMHLDDDEFERALTELARVLVPGAPIAIGTWGEDSDRVPPTETGGASDPRFFCFRSDTRHASLVERHGVVEQFETWRPASNPRRSYQWTLLRTR